MRNMPFSGKIGAKSAGPKAGGGAQAQAGVSDGTAFKYRGAQGLDPHSLLAVERVDAEHGLPQGQPSERGVSPLEHLHVLRLGAALGVEPRVGALAHRGAQADPLDIVPRQASNPLQHTHQVGTPPPRRQDAPGPQTLDIPPAAILTASVRMMNRSRSRREHELVVFLGRHLAGQHVDDAGVAQQQVDGLLPPGAPQQVRPPHGLPRVGGGSARGRSGRTAPASRITAPNRPATTAP